MLAMDSALVLGVLLGVRHAVDPDHLAAVSTLLAERPRARFGAFLGACWGIGHATALLVVGALLLALRAELPPWLGVAFELGVAVMLVALGVRGLAAAARPPHDHGGGVRWHAHEGAAEHVHIARWTLARRPLLIGLAHGLAGSGALTAFVMARMPTATSGLLYMALFAAGSVAGMALLSGVGGALLSRTARSARVATLLARGTSAGAIVVGVLWMAQLL